MGTLLKVGETLYIAERKWRGISINWIEPNPIHRDGECPRHLTFSLPSCWQTSPCEKIR